MTGAPGDDAAREAAAHGDAGVPARSDAVPRPDAVPSEAAALPGEHRGGFRRPLTDPIDIPTAVHPSASMSEADGLTAAAIVPVTADVRWAPEPPAPLPRSAPWALTFAVLGLLVSLFVGWGFLIGLLATGLAVVALRRPWESRGVAVWALCLALLSLVYSAGWLWWAASQGPLF